MPVDGGPFMTSDITVAILAGGQGTRVDGRDKGLMALAGEPLISHVGERLRGQAGALLICANRNANRYAQYGTVVSDGISGFHGPLAGIAAALAACRSRWLLTAPVDSPRPPSDLSRRLHDAAVSGRAAAAVAHTGTRREPLFAMYAANLSESAAEALQRDLPVWRWQDELGIVEVDFSAEAADFLNLNTADDFSRWEEDRRRG
jgi:molybdopterin-guanine dinucleotide biosynthesis protein A